ncbi:retrotransposon protein, putative, ty1-copia subclass [Tanacetum coccineum]
MGKTIPELHAMLKLAEKSIPKKAHVVLAIRQELKKNKASASGTSCIFTIKLFSFPKINSWITDCGTHICNTIQELRGYWKLNKGALDLYVGNRNTAAVEAIGSYELILPSGMIIDNMFYFNAFPRDGIFEIDMHNHISNERSIYTCSNNKSKHNLDSTFLCHGRLGHINKKRIEKLQHDGLLGFLTQLMMNLLTYVYPVYLVRWQESLSLAQVKELMIYLGSYIVISARIPQAPERYGLYIDAEEHELGDHGEPPNYQAALSDPESDKWLEAMNAEMQSMKDNQVWNLVDLPPNCNTVRSKWLFKKKTDMDGNIHTYKARLVAKDFTQTYGVDYEETFSPVADIKAIRILIAIAAYYDYEIWQMDVKTAFLNGHLNEDVYMVQPKGFENPKHPRRVCKLQRSIYGLKQASRSWNKRFDEEIKKYGSLKIPISHVYIKELVEVLLSS